MSKNNIQYQNIDISSLIIYTEQKKDRILNKIQDISDGALQERDISLCGFEILSGLTDFACSFGLYGNIWHSYISYILMTSDNSFTRSCEYRGSGRGSIDSLVRHDLKIFFNLFNYDFDIILKNTDEALWESIFDFRQREEHLGNISKDMSERICSLRDDLKKASNEDDIYDILTDYYKMYGAGDFGLYKAYHTQTDSNGAIIFTGITHIESVVLDDLSGYEMQKTKLIKNTESFICGREANNVLLYGDSGTGKSTCIKALTNMYYERGLRLIEIGKHQIKLLPEIKSIIRNRNYKFILYMDDLSFEEFETDYKYLKALIEGGADSKTENMLIYATSNRRHLIRESWSDKKDIEHDDDMHRSDTVEEKMSLFNRFGLAIRFGKPLKSEYDDIVRFLARQYGIAKDEDELISEANAWAIRHGGMSGRTARQYFVHLLSEF